jgi:hypothetical protein
VSSGGHDGTPAIIAASSTQYWLEPAGDEQAEEARRLVERVREAVHDAGRHTRVAARRRVHRLAVDFEADRALEDEERLVGLLVPVRRRPGEASGRGVLVERPAALGVLGRALQHHRDADRRERPAFTGDVNLRFHG